MANETAQIIVFIVIFSPMIALFCVLAIDAISVKRQICDYFKR